MKNIFDKSVSNEQARKYAKTVDAQFIIFIKWHCSLFVGFKKKEILNLSTNFLHQVKLKQFAA